MLTRKRVAMLHPHPIMQQLPFDAENLAGNIQIPTLHTRRESLIMHIVPPCDPKLVLWPTLVLLPSYFYIGCHALRGPDALINRLLGVCLGHGRVLIYGSVTYELWGRVWTKDCYKVALQVSKKEFNTLKTLIWKIFPKKLR